MYLESISFQGSGLIDLARFSIVIFSLIILLFLQIKTLLKILTIVCYLILVYFTGLLGLWKIGAKNFIADNSVLINSITANNTIDSIKNYTIRKPFDSIWIRKDNSPDININNRQFKNDLKLLQRQIGFYQLECSMPFKMILLNSFIGNGYGLIKLSPKEVDLLYDTKRINGYEIQGISHITDNWFYIWFT